MNKVRLDAITNVIFICATLFLFTIYMSLSEGMKSFSRVKREQFIALLAWQLIAFLNGLDNSKKQQHMT